MVTGLQVFDEQGNLIVDTSTQLTRVLAVWKGLTETVSVVSPDIKASRVFYTVVPFSVVQQVTVTIVNGKVTVAPKFGSTNRTIIVGVY